MLRFLHKLLIVVALFSAHGSWGAGAMLYFRATLDSHGVINQSWFSQNNWYTSLTPITPANRLPTSEDSVTLTTTPVLIGPNSIAVNTMVAPGVNIGGGDISLLTLDTSVPGGAPTTAFNGSTVRVQTEWDLAQGAILNGATLILAGGSFLLLEPGNGGATTTLYVTDSTIWDGGQIVLSDKSGITFTSGTNQLSILPGSALSCNGNSFVANNNNANSSSLLFDNNGIVRADAGTLSLTLGGTLWTNSLGLGKYQTSASNSIVEFFAAYTLQPNNTNVFTGPGLTWFFGNLTGTINGSFEIGDTNSTPGRVQFDGSFGGTGVVSMSASAGAPSLLIWDGGTLNGPRIDVDVYSEVLLTNVLTKTLKGSVLNNAGLLDWVTDNGNLQLDNGSTLNNLPGSVFQAENAAAITGGSAGRSFLINSGTFRKLGSAADTRLTQDTSTAPGPLFINSGLVDVQTGRLLLLGGTNSGTFNAASGTEIRLWQDTNVQTAGATYSGSGRLVVGGTFPNANFWMATNLSVGNFEADVTGVVDGPGDLTATGTLILNGGIMQGSGLINVNPGANFTISNYTGTTLSRTVFNGGAATNTGTGSIMAKAPLTWHNLPGSSFTFQGGATFDVNYIGTTPIFENAGTFLEVATNNATINWAFTNSGVVRVSPYGMSFSQGYTQIAGSTVVDPGATLTVSTSRGNQLQILGGELRGSGSVFGNVVNGGTVHPGNSPGVLTINGSFTNLPGATLAMEINGVAPGSQYSQFNGYYSGNSSWLSGAALSLSFGPGFIPAIGQTFGILTNGNFLGNFSSLQGIRPSANVVMVPRYSSTAVTLLAASEPSPISFSRQGTTNSFSFQTTAGVTNIVQYTDSLSPQNWLNLTTIVGDGSVQVVIDPNATVADRFYRILFQ